MEQGTVTPEAENIGMGRTQSLAPCTEILKVPKGAQTKAWTYAHPPCWHYKSKELVAIKK